jgi:hypothetical protein
MSNTSSVTPYESTTTHPVSESTAAQTTATIGACALGIIAIARWLIDETPEERAVMEKIKQERRRQSLIVGNPETLANRPKDSLCITTMNLHLGKSDSLVRAAEKLGYRQEKLGQSSTSPSLANQPILLRNHAGERLAISRNDNGRIAVSTTGDQRRVQKLVRQHTLDRAVEHLTAKGMQVETASLANGEVQIRARAQATNQTGTAEVKAQIGGDGQTLIDIDCVVGNRCETIVQDFAQAVGGKVTAMTKKSSYYQLPGEPAKTKVEI